MTFFFFKALIAFHNPHLLHAPLWGFGNVVSSQYLISPYRLSFFQGCTRARSCTSFPELTMHIPLQLGIQ